MEALKSWNTLTDDKKNDHTWCVLTYNDVPKKERWITCQGTDQIEDDAITQSRKKTKLNMTFDNQSAMLVDWGYRLMQANEIGGDIRIYEVAVQHLHRLCESANRKEAVRELCLHQNRENYLYTVSNAIIDQDNMKELASALGPPYVNTAMKDIGDKLVLAARLGEGVDVDVKTNMPDNNGNTKRIRTFVPQEGHEKVATRNPVLDQLLFNSPFGVDVIEETNNG